MFPDGFPGAGMIDWRLMTPSGVSGGNPGWQMISKPAGRTWLVALGMGGGGGGAGGASGSGTARLGGAGGASGQPIFVLIPAAFLPETIFAFVPMGGAGGAGNSSGTSGASCLLSVTGDVSNGKIMAAAGGGGGTVSATGQSSTGAPTPETWCRGFQSAQNSAASGGGGANTGGAGSVGNHKEWFAGGSGGGGASTANVNGAGGDQNQIYTIFGQYFRGPLGGAAGGQNNGADGVGNLPMNLPMIGGNLHRVLQFSGGAGGGANGLGAAGNGGKGAPACGGGGGGAGLTSGTGGRGGDGFLYYGWM